MSITSIKNIIRAFLKAHDAQLTITEHTIFIYDIFCEYSFAFEFPRSIDHTQLCLLNDILLLRGFFALYHKSEAYIEFPFQHLNSDHPYIDKDIYLSIGDKCFHCCFRKASPASRMLANSYTTRNFDVYGSKYRQGEIYRRYYDQFMNLRNITLSDDAPNELRNIISDLVPVSFFISPLSEVDLSSIRHFAQVINFELLCLDSNAPQIVMYDEYIHDQRPIVAESFFSRNLIDIRVKSRMYDTALLELHELAVRREVRTSFLAYYSIIECLAEHICCRDMHARMKDILTDTTAFINIDRTCERIVQEYDTWRRLNLGRASVEKAARLEALKFGMSQNEEFRDYVLSNRSFFEEAHQFDGGYISAPIFNKKWNIEDSFDDVVRAAAERLIDMRNALVHQSLGDSRKAISNSSKDESLLEYFRLILELTARRCIKKYYGSASITPMDTISLEKLTSS